MTNISQYQRVIYVSSDIDEGISFGTSPMKIIETPSPFPESLTPLGEIINKTRLNCIYDCFYNEQSGDHPINIEIQAKIITENSESNNPKYLHHFFKFTIESVETSGKMDIKYASFSGYTVVSNNSPDDVEGGVARNFNDTEIKHAFIEIVKNHWTWNICLTSSRELKSDEEGHLYGINLELPAGSQDLIFDEDKQD